MTSVVAKVNGNTFDPGTGNALVPQFLSGTGTPATGLGNINDLYVDLASANWYKKAGGTTWALQGVMVGPAGLNGTNGTNGTPGTNGLDGLSVLTTSGAPAAGIGVDGDYAIDPATQYLYGPKAAGAWPAGVDLHGTNGTNGTGSGTVTSVAMSAPALFAVGGSPVTASGTLALTLATQAANLVLAGPATGAAAAPTLRLLVDADIPATLVRASAIGAAGGVASLDSGAHIPLAQLPASILGQVSYQGTWNATTAAPSTTPSQGQYWIVSVAGTTSLGGITDWKVGDWAIYDAAWDKVDNTDAISSWNGRSGAITPSAGDYTFAQIGSTPTTLGGYGIGDAVSPTATQTLTNKDLTSSTNKFPGIPVNVYTASRTATSVDAGAEAQMSVATANTFTIDPTTLTGMRGLVRQTAAGQVTIVAASGTITLGGLTAKTLQPGSMLTWYVQSTSLIYVNGECAAS